MVFKRKRYVQEISTTKTKRFGIYEPTSPSPDIHVKPSIRRVETNPPGILDTLGLRRKKKSPTKSAEEVVQVLER